MLRSKGPLLLAAYHRMSDAEAMGWRLIPAILVRPFTADADHPASVLVLASLPGNWQWRGDAGCGIGVEDGLADDSAHPRNFKHYRSRYFGDSGDRRHYCRLISSSNSARTSFASPSSERRIQVDSQSG